MIMVTIPIITAIVTVMWIKSDYILFGEYLSFDSTQIRSASNTSSVVNRTSGFGFNSVDCLLSYATTPTGSFFYSCNENALVYAAVCLCFINLPGIDNDCTCNAIDNTFRSLYYISSSRKRCFRSIRLFLEFNFYHSYDYPSVPKVRFGIE